MKNISDPNLGKILVHESGLGEATADTVAKRAREIAVIAGHTEPSRADLAQAHLEMSGATLPETSLDEASTMESLSRDPSDPRADRGRQVPNFDGTDEEKIAERLVSEGVEEAQHDQMFAARRKKVL